MATKRQLQMSHYLDRFLTLRSQRSFWLVNLDKNLGNQKTLIKKIVQFVKMKIINKSKYLPTYPPIHNPPRYYTFTHMYKICIRIYILHMIYVGKGDWTLVSLVPHQCFGHQNTPQLCKTIWYQMELTPWTSMKFLLMCIITFELQFFS
jgi:hypothetical protein